MNYFPLAGPPGGSDRLAVVDEGLGDTTIQRIGAAAGTGSYQIGSLAPGYANSVAGFAVYARLLSSVGAIFLGIAVADRFALTGLALLLVGAVAFVALSVIAVRGEIATYRALKR